MIENVRQRKKELKEGGQCPAGMCAGDRLPPHPNTHTAASGLNLARRGLKTFPSLGTEEGGHGAQAGVGHRE